MRVALVVRSIGDRGEVRRERPTGPIGEQCTRRGRVEGEEGGRMEELRQSRGVTGERMGVRRGDTGTTWGAGLWVRGEGTVGE